MSAVVLWSDDQATPAAVVNGPRPETVWVNDWLPKRLIDSEEPATDGGC